MRVIEQAESIEIAVQKFQEEIKKQSVENEKREWRSPSGNIDNIMTYRLKTACGDLGFGVLKLPSKPNILFHLFSLSWEKPMVQSVEINVPLELNRRFSGVFVEKEGAIWLCHRGRFTAYRGSIPKEFALSYFNVWAGVQDGNRKAKIIPIVALTSSDIAKPIAEFILNVQKLKEEYKQSIALN